MTNSEKLLAQNIKVLVADDVQSMRQILRATLRELGFRNIIEASDGKKTLNMLDKTSFHLVFCDWEMPEHTGDEILRYCRKSEKNSQTVFIMCTGLTDAENVKDAIMQGFSNFITKPFNQKTLKEKLEKYFVLK